MIAIYSNKVSIIIRGSIPDLKVRSAHESGHAQLATKISVLKCRMMFI